MQALPADYLDELFIALEVERETAVIRQEKAEADQQKASKLAAMRQANLAILHKQGLRPLH